MNPFDILELKPGATAEEIKAAYHRLAKQWHPDRFDGEEKLQAEDRFRHISEAFALLRDPYKRQQYEQQAATPPAPAPEPAKPVVADRTPDDWLEEAKQELETGDTERALGLVQYAIRLAPERADLHAFLAHLMEKQGKDQRTIVKAFEAAFQLNPKDVNVAVRLAEHYQALGMQARAQGVLQIAREHAPNHKYFKQAAVKAAPATGKGKGKEAPPQSEGLLDQVKSLWNRLARKG